MTIFKHEFKMNLKSLLIWTLSIGLMSCLLLLLYPSLKTTINEMSSDFSNMGGFSAAFGLDKLNIGEIMGFYGTEIGAIYALGSSMFAALLGIGILSKEESGHTSEFIFTLPISRKRVITEKLLSVIFIILCFNLICILLILISFLIIGESVDMKVFLLYHLAQLIMNIEIGAICFALSAFSKKANLGSGLSVALLLYFTDIMAKIVKETEFLKYITPFYYSGAADIITSSSIDVSLLMPGLLITIISIAIGYVKYTKKDLAS